MLIIGLTGSIGMGKSTTAAMFREAGVPVYDADAAVADLSLVGGAAVAPLEAAFPGVTKAGAVDREALRTRVLGDDEAMGRLNKIVHPLVGADRVQFFKAAEEAGNTQAPSEELAALQKLQRNAQFYWDFVMVENSEGAHNPDLTFETLDKAEAAADQALSMLG